MFKGCSSLTSIDLSNFKTTNLKKMLEMFYNCPNLKTIDFSSITDESLENSDIFNDLPEGGTIKIKKSLYERIKEQIPSSWSINIVE